MQHGLGYRTLLPLLIVGATTHCGSTGGDGAPEGSGTNSTDTSNSGNFSNGSDGSNGTNSSTNSGDLGGGGTAGSTGAGGTTMDSGGANNGGAGDSGNSKPPGFENPLGSAKVDLVDLIDDLEHGTAFIPPLGGRDGSWYTYNDGSGGNQTPTAGSDYLPIKDSGRSNGSRFKAHTQGSGFGTWGAGLGVNLKEDPISQVKSYYDASFAEGVTFWARGTGLVSVKFHIPATVDGSEGGTCSSMCYDHFQHLIQLSDEWQSFKISFESLTQEGWGTPATFDSKSISSIQFQVPANVEFDVDIDDLGFYRAGAAEDPTPSPRFPEKNYGNCGGSNKVAPGGFYVDGRTICTSGNSARRLRGFALPSFEWNPGGDQINDNDYNNMAAAGGNVVRIALNQGYWLDNNSGYRSTIANHVSRAKSAGLAVILDLHRGDHGELQEMADARAVSFWQGIADAYKNDGNVIFELFNEPRDVPWRVWLNGGGFGGNYNAVGMKALYAAVRGRGAHNLVIVGGLDAAYDLAYVPYLANQLGGDVYNVVYATHPYDQVDPKRGVKVKQPGDWDRGFGFVAKRFPVIATEFGEFCGTDLSYTKAFVDQANQLDMSWTGWAWWVGDCNFPALLSNRNPAQFNSFGNAVLGGL